MKGRPRIPQKIADQLLVESRHRCNVCRRNVVQTHHITKIDSAKGNLPFNLIVICPECHRRAELPNSYFERKISPTQLRKYKKEWIELCKTFPTIAFEKPILIYCLLNEPRIRILFNQLSSDLDNTKVMEIKRHVEEVGMPMLKNMPLERMMQTVINGMEFANLEVIEREEVLSHLEKLEGLPVCVTKVFYGHGLKVPQYYEKYGMKEFPYIFYNQKVGDKTIRVKVSYDPKYITSMTGYMELSGHHRLSFYGIVKRVKDDGIITIEIMPLSIGLKQPINPINTHFRLF